MIVVVSSRASGEPSKLRLLLRLLRERPLEFSDRLLTTAEFYADKTRRRATKESVSSRLLIQECDRRLGGEFSSFLNDDPLIEIQERVNRARAALREQSLGGTFHNASTGLATFCYAVCRAIQPEVVVETGVGYGVTSAFFLQALAANKRGTLWSIDLPPVSAADRETGLLVPSDLRGRWRLLRGRVRRLLPPLVSQLPKINVFLHDSLHTYRNMTFEFGTIWPKLSHGEVLLSDDVALNRAFEDFTGARSGFAAIDEDSLFGIAIKQGS